MLTTADYMGLYDSCVVKSAVDLDHVVQTAIENEVIYQSVGIHVNIPWPVIACIHFRESNQNFKKHLHNGDPLTAKTVHVPANRPAFGSAPFTWQESAMDALTGLWYPRDWSIASCLEFMERYNGIGYQRHGLNTPYLWDYTNHYTSGLFTSDGKMDLSAKESRPGAVAILKTMEAKGVSLEFSSLGLSGPTLG